MDAAPPDLTPTAVASAARYAADWLAFRQRYLRVPGVQAAVWHEDGLVLSTASGLADVESGTPLTPAHVFRIASHSKTFTATAVFRLREQGRLGLDDPVGRHLPWLGGSPLGDRTVADLLSHGGGVVRDGVEADFWQLERPFPDVTELEGIAAPSAAVLPAQTTFKYSNIAYGLLGLVVESVTGEGYREHVTRDVVERLGLTGTAPELTPELAGRVATGYSALAYADSRVPVDQVDSRALAAATGFAGTAEDVCRYASAHFLGDERLLSDDSKRRMQREAWEVERDSAYALGLAVQRTGGRRLLGHGGGWPGHITRTLFDPEARLAVSVFTNAVDGPASELVTGVVRLVDLAAAQEPDSDPATRARFCGRWAGLWGVLDVVDLGGRLVAVDPTEADPAAHATTLQVEDETTLRTLDTPGYSAPGEAWVLSDGVLRGGGGQAHRPLETFVAGLGDRVRAPR